jgi:hypothetical protein
LSVSNLKRIEQGLNVLIEKDTRFDAIQLGGGLNEPGADL